MTMRAAVQSQRGGDVRALTMILFFVLPFTLLVVLVSSTSGFI